MANTRKASTTRGRNARKPSTLRNGKRETNIVGSSQEQQKNVSPPETRRPWQGRLRARGRQQSSTRGSATENNPPVSSDATTSNAKSESTSKIDNDPNSVDDENKEQEQVPVDEPPIEESDKASHESTDTAPNEDALENAGKAKGPRSVLKETFNPQPPSVVREGNRYNLTDYPDEFNKEVKQLLTRLHRCFRHREEPESKEFIAALMNAAIYSAKCGAMSALYFETSAEALATEIARCRKQRLKDANEAIAKLPKISEEKESRKCRFVEEPEVNIYAPHDFEVKDRALRKFEMFLDGKTTKDLSKAHLEFKHDGPLSAEDLSTYITMAEMMQSRINQQRPSVPLLSAASVYIKENSSGVDAPAPRQGLPNIQQPGAASSSSSSGSRLRLTEGPSLADSSRIQEIIGAVKRKRERSEKSKSQEEDKEEEEKEFVMPSKRPRLKEKIDDADQSRVVDCETNKAQTPEKGLETEKASKSQAAKENTPPRPSKARVIEQSPERPARRSRTPMQDCAAAAQAQVPQVEDTEAKPRRSARGRTPAPKTA